MATSLAREAASSADDEDVTGWDRWKQSEDPSVEDLAVFQKVLWHKLRIESANELRRQYLRRREREGGDPGEPKRSEAQLEARSVLYALGRKIEELDSRDRALLLEAAIATGPVRSNAERQRLFRIRQLLAAQVQALLNGDPQD